MKKFLFILTYWLLSLTWGIIMSSIGFITILIVLMLGGKPHKNGCTLIVEIGGNWGGLELGCFALCGSYSKTDKIWFERTRRHEFGHNIQHMLLGPFFIFIVGIPSAIRYWYKIIATKRGKKFSSDWYDSIWFEGTATKWGTDIMNKFWLGGLNNV